LKNHFSARKVHSAHTHAHTHTHGEGRGTRQNSLTNPLPLARRGKTCIHLVHLDTAPAQPHRPPVDTPPAAARAADDRCAPIHRLTSLSSHVLHGHSISIFDHLLIQYCYVLGTSCSTQASNCNAPDPALQNLPEKKSLWADWPRALSSHSLPWIHLFPNACLSRSGLVVCVSISEPYCLFCSSW